MNCEIGAIALSDHGTVELHVDLNSDKVKGDRWRLNTILLKENIFSDTFSKDLKSFFKTSIGFTEKISSVWEASKAFIRGKIIAHSSKVKRKTERKKKD